MKISTKSIKRRVLEETYVKIRKDKEVYLKQQKQWICFFSGEQLEEHNLVDFHHLGGRIGKHQESGIELLIYEPWIVPAKRKYHNMWHDKPLEFLMKQYWWNSFVLKIEQLDNILYLKLCQKILKSKPMV